jgi:ParB/RepB/Spo0J family partition protein
MSPDHDPAYDIVITDEEVEASPILYYTRKRKNSQDEHRPPPDPAVASPESMLAKQFAGLNLPGGRLSDMLDPKLLAEAPPDSSLGKLIALEKSGRCPTDAEMKEFHQQLAEEGGFADLPRPSPTYEHLSRSSVSYRLRKAPAVEEPTLDLKVVDIVDVGFPGIHQDETEDAHRSLTASIAEYGLVEPVTVVPDATTPGKYVLIDGRRRLRAVAAARRRTIRATIRFIENATEACIVHLISNCVRKTVSPFELASYCELLKRDNGVDVPTLAKLLNCSNSHIYSLIACLSLPSDILTAWKDQHPCLTLRQMIALSRVVDPSAAWIAMRAAYDRREHRLTAAPPPDDDTESPGTTDWRGFRRPSKAQLAKFRDFAAQAALPSDPESVRELLVAILDFCRGARAQAPSIFAPVLGKKRHGPPRSSGSSDPSPEDD